MARHLLKNARLVCPAQNLDIEGHLLIEDGQILSVETGNPADITADDTHDCGGDLLVPGLIDMRVQSADPGAEHLESLSSLLEAAQAGGITQLVTQPGTDPVIDNAAMIDSLTLRASRLAGPNLFTTGALTKNQDCQHMAELGMMAEAGGVAFSSGTQTIQDSLLMRRVLSYAAMLDKPVMHHCADPYLTADTEMHEGETSVRLGLRGVPAAAEQIILDRDLALVALTGARYHAAHISTAAAVKSLRRAKEEGLAVTADTAPPYFLLNDMALSGYESAFKFDPPLRSEEDRQAIIEALADGTIDIIASDHLPVNADEKMQPFALASHGASGLESLLPLSLNLYHNGQISLMRLVEALSLSPANLLDLPGGMISPGSPAHLTQINLDKGWILDAQHFRSRTRITPFNRQPVQGQAVHIWVDGDKMDCVKG